jgi:hypothetical protein
MIDTNTKLQDVVHLDTLSDEIDATFAGDRIAQEKKLVRKIDMRMMPMMMLICTCRLSDPGPDSYCRLTRLRTQMYSTTLIAITLQSLALAHSKKTLGYMELNTIPSSASSLLATS